MKKKVQTKSPAQAIVPQAQQQQALAQLETIRKEFSSKGATPEVLRQIHNVFESVFGLKTKHSGTEGN